MALAAEFYSMPLAAYLDHLRTTRERYGESLATLDLQFALELRRLKIERINEASKAANSNGSA